MFAVAQLAEKIEGLFEGTMRIESLVERLSNRKYNLTHNQDAMESNDTFITKTVSATCVLRCAAWCEPMRGSRLGRKQCGVPRLLVTRI